MGLVRWARRQNVFAPIWLATGAAVVAMYASGVFALVKYAPALHGVVIRATVVSMSDSNYRRCGYGAAYPEKIVTFRPVGRAHAGQTFTDQMCLFDVRIGDTLTVARQKNGDVYVNPITSFVGVLARVAGWTAATWLAVFVLVRSRRWLRSVGWLKSTEAE
jgi:hypothetical protein